MLFVGDFRTTSNDTVVSAVVSFSPGVTSVSGTISYLFGSENG
jgi:hypothetical protein